MDWGPVKKAIGTFAPWIAGTLGTPFTGVAVKALCGALGMTSDKADPKQIMTALSGASPEQLQAIKQAEAQHQEAMTKLNFENVEALEKTAAADRDSARKRQIALKDRTPAHLAYIIIIGFLAGATAEITAFTLFPDIAAKIPREGWLLIGQVFGYLASEAKAVLAYFFGTTADSGRKTDLLAKAQPVSEDS